mmetsp:Transcript_2591/g.7797  ORF Transcript_2591/g.7797 Transcript_2591/m.7797 type:complete len:225 (-) Transcript_2591:224-898(-)
MPFMDSTSTIAFAFFDMYGSMHCVSASMPAAAVTDLGVLTCSDGSTTANVGIISSERMETFRSSWTDFTTAFLVTSDPVPAVVGIAITGSGRFSSGRPLPMTSQNSSGSPPFVATAAIAFAASTAEPPPIPITTSQPLACFAPSRTSSSVGSRDTENVANSSSCSLSASNVPRNRSHPPLPVTTRTLLAFSFLTSSPSLPLDPTPKIILPALTNSNESMSPVCS